MTFVRAFARWAGPFMVALLLCLQLASADPGGGASSTSTVSSRQRTRTRSRLRRPAFAQRLRRQLVKAGASVVKRNEVFYHQIKDGEHRTQWAHAHAQQGLAMLGKWLSAGGYPGLWTSDEARGWYGQHGGRPVEIRLKPGALFIDLEYPAQKAIYEAWKRERAQQPAKGADIFQLLKDKKGVELARKVAGIRAPKEGQFLQDLGIAGVLWYDTYGRRCPVVLNPAAVESVRF
ncbi:MAG: hypothetical protein KC503_03505 [Myxococcales bacterium]|nr:hypothetical protein [Myxococcales bacterium]